MCKHVSFLTFPVWLYSVPKKKVLFKQSSKLCTQRGKTKKGSLGGFKVASPLFFIAVDGRPHSRCHRYEYLGKKPACLQSRGSHWGLCQARRAGF